MREKTLKALKLSIQHWHENWDIAYLAYAGGIPIKASKNPFKINIPMKMFSWSCPLCAVFNPPDVNDRVKCNRCPVKIQTGEDTCENTPWNDILISILCPHHSYDVILVNIEDELKFLYSLLPKNCKTIWDA